MILSVTVCFHGLWAALCKRRWWYNVAQTSRVRFLYSDWLYFNINNISGHHCVSTSYRSPSPDMMTMASHCDRSASLTSSRAWFWCSVQQTHKQVEWVCVKGRCVFPFWIKLSERICAVSFLRPHWGQRSWSVLFHCHVSTGKWHADKFKSVVYILFQIQALLLKYMLRFKFHPASKTNDIFLFLT